MRNDMYIRSQAKIRATRVLIIILVVAVCFMFAYIKDSHASDFGELRGVVQGMSWNMRSAVLKNKIVDGVSVVVLEFSDKEILNTDVCKDNTNSVNDLVVRVPVNARNNNRIELDYEDMRVSVGGVDGTEILCYHDMVLNENELNADGLVYVSGRIQLVSKKMKTEIVGQFKARVCNLN